MNGHQLCNWNFYPFIPLLCLPLVDSPNELSSMIDFHISGMPTLTKHSLLEKLCHACGMEWAVKYRAGNRLARALPSLMCNVHANRHTFSSVRGNKSLYDLQTKLNVRLSRWKISCQDGSSEWLKVASLKYLYMVAFYVAVCHSVLLYVTAHRSVRNDVQFADGIIRSLSLWVIPMVLMLELVCFSAHEISTNSAWNAILKSH